MVKICLDAGHYGKYNRGEAPGYYESEIVWKLTNYQKMYLELYDNVTVITTRDKEEVDLDLWYRGRKAAGCDLFLSNHSNAADDHSVRRASGIYMVSDNKVKFDDVSKEVAGIIAKTVGQVMGVPYETYSRQIDYDRDGNGYMDDEYYGVLFGAKSVKVPGIIMEHSFHTNYNTCVWLMNDANLRTLARAEADAIAKYFGLTKKPTSVVAKKQPTGKDEKLRGVYQATKKRAIRNGAGLTNKALVTVPAGTIVRCYSQYRNSLDGKKWKYVDCIVDGVKYTGFIYPTGWKKIGNI